MKCFNPQLKCITDINRTDQLNILESKHITVNSAVDKDSLLRAQTKELSRTKSLNLLKSLQVYNPPYICIAILCICTDIDNIPYMLMHRLVENKLQTKQSHAQ